MGNWTRLPSGHSPAAGAVRLLAFVGALGAGFYLGWRFFLAPEPVPTPEPTGTPVAQATGTAPATAPVPVRLTGTPASSLGGVVDVGRPAPDFTLEDLQGQPRSLSDFQGKVVLINFWTTWCPPCRMEMPALQQAYEDLRDQGFVVLGVNWTAVDDPEEVGPYVQELGLTFPILLDIDSEVSERRYRVIGLPTSVFVGRDGTVREVYIGPIPLDQLRANVETLLTEAP